MDKRLLYSAVLVASLSTNYAQAQVNDPVLPNPVQLKLDGTDTVAIKNILADKWLTNGNAYGTQTSLGTSGLGFVIVPNKGDDGQPNGTYSFCNDKSGKFGAFSNKIFINSVDKDGGNSYVDYNNQGIKKTYWKVTPNGTTFRFQSNEQPDTYAGYNPNDTGLDGKGESAKDGQFRPALAENSEYGLDWAAYPYTYFYRLEKLKDAINAAVDEGLDVSESEAIYNNSNAEYWQLKEAYRMISDARRNKAMADATADSPVSITEFVPDANCDALAGWTHDCIYDDTGDVGHGGHGTNWQAHSTVYTAPDGYQTDKFIERWVHGDSDPVTNTSVKGEGRLSDGVLSQTLHKLPAGGYKVTCYAMATQQSKGDSYQVEGVSVFADTKSTPNSQTVATKAGVPQKYEFLLDIKEGEDLTIGFKLDKCTANWVFVDNFQIEYCGSSFKAMNLADVQKAAAELEAQMGGMEVCPTYTDKASELIAAVGEMTTDTDEAEINAMKQQLADIAAKIDKSSALYAELTELDATIGDFLSEGPAGTEVDELEKLYNDCGYEVNESVSDLLSSFSLNNEQLTQYMADLKVLLEAAQNASIKPGDDITRKIVNPSFDSGSEGWTVKEGNPTFNETYKNCEVYQGTFDIYQDITNIPDGVYELSVLAFQRVAGNDIASVAHDNGTEDITAFIYANDLETPFTSPYTYGMKENSGDDYKYNLNGEEVYIPNSMKGMAAATTENPEAYTVTVPMFVEGGTLRIGVREKRRPSNGTADWAIWDNFRLKYIGGKGEALNVVTTPLIAKAAGLLDSKMNADVRTQLEAAKTALETEATVPGIHTLSAAIEAANTSIEAYKPLKEAIDNAQTRYEENEASSTTSETAKGLYNAAVATAQGIYDNGTAADAEIPAAIKALNEGVTKYVINDIIADASEAKPADITKVIANSDFATMSSTGWDVKDGTMGFQSGNNVEAGEFFNCTFNLQQTLVGLPAGMYRLTTQAFYRNGSDASAKVDDSDQLKYDVNENAYLYFSDKEIPTEEGKKVATELPETKQAIKTITAHKIAEDTWNSVGLSDNGGLKKMDDGMYIPDNMITAQAFFKSDAGSAYDSKPLNFNYDGNSDFRIGLIKNVTVTNDWTIVKNFKLYYLGVDPTGISEIVTDANAVATKIYNASGMQIGKLQKGINIIETVMKDGSKKVKKVVVK